MAGEGTALSLLGFSSLGALPDQAPTPRQLFNCGRLLERSEMALGPPASSYTC